jgi:ABC-type proline/glycine betaine transport system substrate-binding protein
MKKLLYFAAAVAALSFASCGNGDRAASSAPETIVIAEDDVTLTPVDSDSVLVTDVQAAAVGITE